MAARAGTTYQGGSRFYIDPDSGKKLPGVTSVLAMLPKGFLGPWNASMAANWAVDNIAIVADLAKRDPKACAELIKGAARRYTSLRADIGTAAHGMFETMAAGGEIEGVTPEMEPYYRHFSEFLAKWQPSIVAQEYTVWDDEIGYAGSADACVDIDGERLVLDYKTSKDLHEETGIQLACYRAAKHILAPDGSKVPNYATVGGAVLHVTPAGWKLCPFACGEAELGVFKNLLAIHAWEARKRGVIGRPLVR